MMKPLSALGALGMFAAMAAPAAAGGIVFPVAGCVPTQDTAAKLDTLPYVQHALNQVGPIRLVCPILQLDALFAGQNHNLRMAYRDSTGTGTGAGVSVSLVAGNLLTGARTEIAKINSNNFADKVYAAKEISFQHTFDHENFYYFLGVTLTRTNTSQTVEIHAANVE